MNFIPVNLLQIGDRFTPHGSTDVYTVRALPCPTISGGHTIVVEPNPNGLSWVLIPRGAMVNRVDGGTVTS